FTRIDFKTDVAVGSNNSNSYRYSYNIALRNQAGTLASNWPYEASDIYYPLLVAASPHNDVHAAVVNNKTYVAVATDGGVSVINEDDEVVVDFTNNGASYDIMENIFLLNNGDLYFTVDNDSQSGQRSMVFVYDISRFSSDQNFDHDSSAITNGIGIYDIGIGVGISPPLNAATAGADEIFATQGTSFVNTGSNTVFIGHFTDGVAVFNEKQGDETNGSVKYYTKDYITEEMIGDVRAMWPMEGKAGGLNDASVNGQDLTNNNSVTFTSTGVRGHAADFVAASSMSLTDADHADYTFTTEFSAGMWAYRDIDSGGIEGILFKRDINTNAQTTFSFHLNTNDTLGLLTYTSSNVSNVGPAMAVGRWYNIVGTYDGANIRMYIDGVLFDT
ncbi:MAG: hypothetical protein QF704_14715, partial [Anaerolineales bacterium]|nr:hypothetical protein [Anaerolineales bacterium]